MIQYIVWCMLVIFIFPRNKIVHNFEFGVYLCCLGVLLPAELPRSGIIAHIDGCIV
jgi:hypothetical protein